ncbi:hypothetical protein SeLEV6574_g05079 [Synchytrium endobioticum]|uniref:SAC domain-containing protein n=1 Tax=Synchytrium endobioticum TaxID=286115 RepID=A0A507CW54_9FUNG|nr:hypothetical protein SeLEV6574_g05079 [Synchytrium endobioticum]
MASSRDTCRLFRTSQGRILVERPLRATKSQQAATQLLVVDLDGSVSVKPRREAYPVEPGSIASISEIFGIVGVLKLAFGNYLLTVSARSLAATLQSHKIYRIVNGNILAIGKGPQAALDKHQIPPPPPSSSSSSSAADLSRYLTDKELLHDISRLLNSGHLYYSPTYDITHSLQHNHILASGNKGSTVIDDRYWFNRQLSDSLINASGDATAWIMKTICGFAGTVDTRVPSTEPTLALTRMRPDIYKSYSITLLSRTSTRRIGTRYMRRGLDLDGNAANNVESEQITFPTDHSARKAISSYVQIRGSVPGLWSQELNLHYKPAVRMVDIDKDEAKRSITAHFNDLGKQYIDESGGREENGKMLLLNLLNDSGFEHRLTQAYEKAVGLYADPKKFVYEGFPVNTHCRGMNYRKMDLLVDRTKDILASINSFMADGDIPSLRNPASSPLKTVQTSP